MWRAGLAVAVVSAVLGGCGDACPPFPAGTVEIGGELLEAACPPGIACEAIPGTRAQARSWQAWERREEDPLRAWALARLELARPFPDSDAALSLLSSVAAGPGTACLVDADRVLALWAADRRAEAIGTQGCAAETTAGRLALARLLSSLHPHAAAVALDPSVRAGHAPAGGIDYRDLFRDGPRLALDHARAPGALARAIAAGKLAELTVAHCARFRLGPEAAGWWLDLAGLPEDSPVFDALRDLEAVPSGRPESLAEAEARAGRLASIAARLGGAGHGLPAVRALHLRAWALDVAGSPASLPAWRDLLDASGDWPQMVVTAMERLAGAEILGGRPADASLLMDGALVLARTHALDALSVRLAREQWVLRRRPALARVEVEALLALHAESAPRLSADQVLAQLEDLGPAAWRANWAPLARAACSENRALAEESGEPCRSDACLAVLGYAAEAAADRLALLSEAEGLAATCHHAETRLAILASTAFFRLQAGDRSAAEAAFAQADSLVPEAGQLWAAYLAAMRLADPAVPFSGLDAFDDALAGVDLPPGDRDVRGWMTEGYGQWIRNRVREGDGSRQVLDLVARGEGARWLGRAWSPLPASPVDTLAFLATPEHEALIATSWAPAPEIRQCDPPAEILFDSAAPEGSALVLGGQAPDHSGALPVLGRWLDALATAGREGPLLALGTGPGVSIAPALLPLGGSPAGLLRPTGLWVPTACGAPSTWGSGTVFVATGRPGAIGLLGVDRLVASLPAGWTDRTLSSASTLASVEGYDVVHLSAHGEGSPDGQAVLVLGPERGDVFEARHLRSLSLKPGALVVLAACETGGGSPGELPLDLPMAAFQAGAGAVIFSRYPVSSGPLHEALGRLYSQMPFPCTELVDRWHQVRRGAGSDLPDMASDGAASTMDIERRRRHRYGLLGVEVAVSTACLPPVRGEQPARRESAP